MSTSFMAICLGVAAVGFSILLWSYWALAYPIVRRQLKFRMDARLDRIRLLVMGGEIPRGSKIFLTMETFLEKSAEVAGGDGWIHFDVNGEDDARTRKIRLAAMHRQMDEEHLDIRKLFESTIEDLVALYIAQRPFVVCSLIPIILCAIFMQHAKQRLSATKIEYAAGALAMG
jgi:hypothetical protein